MAELLGIIYQDLFQASRPIQKILENASLDKKDMHSYSHFHLGILGSAFSWNSNRTILLGLEGEITNLSFLQQKTGVQKLQDCLIKAYEMWGIHFVSLLKGQFILALLDQNKEKLFLVRDQMGIKPLYWYQDQYNFIFGTRIKSLLKTQLVPKTPSREAIAAYLFFGYFPQELTPLKNISKLLPGHYLEINANQSKSIYAYWSLSSFFIHPSPIHPNLLVKKLDQSLSEMIKNDPFSPSACLFQSDRGARLNAFYLAKQEKLSTLLCLDNDPNDYRYYSDFLNAPQKKMNGLNALEQLIDFVWMLEEPVADPAAFNIFSSTSLFKNRLFLDLGSSELFNLHPRYLPVQRPGAKDFIPIHFKRKLLKGLYSIFPDLALKYLKYQQSPPWQTSFLSQNAIFNEKEIAAVSPELSPLFDTEVFILKFHHLHRMKNQKDAILYFDLKTRFPDLYALSCEKLLPAQSWVNPFFDLSLIEFLVNIPEAERPLIASSLEQKLYHSHPPQALPIPWAIPSLDHLIPLLRQGSLVEEGLISESFLLQFQKTKKKKQLWSILVLEIWFRLFINESINDDPPRVQLTSLLQKRKSYG